MRKFYFKLKIKFIKRDPDFNRLTPSIEISAYTVHISEGYLKAYVYYKTIRFWKFSFFTAKINIWF